MDDNKMLIGLVGSSVSAIGAGISATEIQAIISTVLTIVGFIISVLVPFIIKIVAQIKEAKKDGKISEEEKEAILDSFEEFGNKISGTDEKCLKTPKNRKKNDSKEEE